MNLIVSFGTTQALDELPPKSIALDGYVRGPAIDTASQRYSFDHHDHCIRHVTSATCVQVLDALLVGFDPTGFHVYVNDVDADTVLSVYLLQQPARAQDLKTRTLVDAVGKIDAHGPAYPLPPEIAAVTDEYLEHVLAPERQLRRSGQYGKADLRELLAECLQRTEEFLAGKLVPASPRKAAPYRILFSKDDMALLEGDREMMGLAYRDGWNKVVAMLPAKEGSHAFTVAKKSEFVDWDVPGVLAALSAVEPGWGGGSTVGGAPRNADGTRSKLSAEKVWAIVCQA
jgi:hypothetical protein